ncbi:MAG: anaerobic sulfatase maturase [Chitinivibrionales bacterium]|nr:anaerobic sulfatase maturase [Chitinivibrionales bacterium]MBD3355964.1 anaerobic sulfatase maturase [Chitinivibrionales bacterium]
MKPFSLLIKPVSADCNLRCEYCFYLDHSSLYPQTKVHRMSDAVLEKMISSYMATPQPQYAFGWQGGEPTLMGVDFFKRVIELQKKHGRPGSSVANGLQTNATLIDDEMARLFAEYHFLCGVSLDGPAAIHDRFRKNGAGAGSHAQVLRGIQHLQNNGTEFNILTLVSSANVNRAREVYEYLRDRGFHYHQYIPCVEFGESGTLLPFAVDGKQWGDFLCEIFDIWYKTDTRIVSIRLFDSILTYLVDGIYNICHMGRNCNQYFVVEYNGDIYPCDFFVEKSLLIGNVADITWEQASDVKVYHTFGKQKTLWNTQCSGCAYAAYCSGDCLKHRLPQSGGDPKTLSVLCAGWKQFYAHALPGFQQLAEQIHRERSTVAAPGTSPSNNAASYANAGRNAPCPCGSGKKFKKCCMKQI